MIGRLGFAVGLILGFVTFQQLTPWAGDLISLSLNFPRLKKWIQYYSQLIGLG